MSREWTSQNRSFVTSTRAPDKTLENSREMFWQQRRRPILIPRAKKIIATVASVVVVLFAIDRSFETTLANIQIPVQGRHRLKSLLSSSMTNIFKTVILVVRVLAFENRTYLVPVFLFPQINDYHSFVCRSLHNWRVGVFNLFLLLLSNYIMWLFMNSDCEAAHQENSLWNKFGRRDESLSFFYQWTRPVCKDAKARQQVVYIFYREKKGDGM